MTLLFTPVYLERDNKTGEITRIIPTGFSPCSEKEALILQSKLTMGRCSALQSATGNLSHHSMGH